MRSPALLAAALFLWGLSAAAAEPEDRLTFQAGRVEADPGLRQITLQDRIDVRVGRYRLTGDRLRLTLEGDAITFDGDGRLALCPCPDPPVTLAARGGQLSASGDLFLRWPRLELFKVPVLALPYAWLRAPDRPGLLPPFLALRGADGLVIGAGAHLPWRGRDGALRSLDLTAAGYLQGGAELGARLLTPASTARITADWIRGDRIALEARGVFAPGAREGVALAWEADAIRGARARRGTIALAAAAAPFDHAVAETSIRAAPGGSLTALFAGGLLARAGRGEGVPVAGPEASATVGGPLGSLGTWEAGAGGLVLGDGATGEALPVGRAVLSSELDARPGPFSLRLRAGGRALVAGPPGRAEPGAAPGPAPLDAALGARLALELPLIRSFGAGPGEAPLLHWIAPALELGGLFGEQRGALFRALFAPIEGAAGLASGGLSTALGRAVGPTVRLDLRAGALAPRRSAPEALALARLTADTPFVAGKLELTVTSGRPRAAGEEGRANAGFALLAHARAGPARGPALIVDLAASGGGDPRAARSITGLTGGIPGAELSAFAQPGSTLGVATVIPFPAALQAVLQTTLRADVDLGAGALIAVRGLTAYRHPCGCLGLGLSGAHRVGREGVDVAVSLDLAPIWPANLLR